jgi:hypothetical protein
MLCDHCGKLYQLVKRAPWCAKQLDQLTSLTARVLEDEHFVTLLRAEGFHNLPIYLRDGVHASRKAGQERKL